MTNLELGARGNPLGGAFGKHVWGTAGEKGGQAALLEASQEGEIGGVRGAGVVDDRGVLADAAQLSLTQEVVGQRGHVLGGGGLHFGEVVLDEQDVYVVDDLAVAGADLGGADPAAFGEVGRDDEVVVGVLAGGNHVVLADVDDDVGLAELPAVCEDRRRR
jgi:hypothetical protein